MEKKNYIASLFEEIKLEEVLYASNDNPWNEGDEDFFGGNERDNPSGGIRP